MFYFLITHVVDLHELCQLSDNIYGKFFFDNLTLFDDLTLCDSDMLISRRDVFDNLTLFDD